ncbi:MAG: hypothetical protein KBT34_02790 [Prevotella sp.]|nr:hypothetical protein [Candidatus Prevotella equi]
MDKLLLRLTIIYTAIYFLAVFVLAYNGIAYFNDFYIVLFEICACNMMSSQGKYHCRYMKYTAYGVTFGDTITRLDNCYDWLPIEMLLLLVTSVVSLGVATSFTLALRHFYKVKQLKRRKDELHRGRTE